jgi:cytochrome b involved in lipid metabolism
LSSPYYEDDNPEYGEILRLLDANTSAKEIKKVYPDIHWCLMGNSIYDITNFKHPGGQYIVNQIYGRDVGRFIFGCYSLENYGFLSLDSWVHSVEAMAVLESFKFGDLQSSSFNILIKNASMSLKKSGSFENKTQSVINSSQALK